MLNNRAFGQAIINLQKILLVNRIMLAQSEEQHERYDAESEKIVCEEFKFPDLNEDIRIAIVSSFLEYQEENKSDIARSIFDEIVFVEPFDFYQNVANKLAYLISSYKDVLDAEENHRNFPNVAISQISRYAETIYQYISVLNEYLEYENNSLKSIFQDPNHMKVAGEYALFREKEKQVYDIILTPLRILSQVAVEDVEKFNLWCKENNKIVVSESLVNKLSKFNNMVLEYSAAHTEDKRNAEHAKDVSDNFDKIKSCKRQIEDKADAASLSGSIEFFKQDILFFKQAPAVPREAKVLCDKLYEDISSLSDDLKKFSF